MSDERHPADRLPEFVRGRADDQERIRAHVAACDRCRAEVAWLRALAEEPAPSLSPEERARVFDEFWYRRAARRAIWPNLLKVAAVIAVLLAGGLIWRVGRPGAEGQWSPTMAAEGWEADLSALKPEARDVRVALGYEGESRSLSWEEGTLSPETLEVPWEHAR